MVYETDNSTNEPTFEVGVRAHVRFLYLVVFLVFCAIVKELCTCACLAGFYLADEARARLRGMCACKCLPLFAQLTAQPKGNTMNKRSSTPRERSSYCGCPWLHVPYSEQLERKNAVCAELFGEWITKNPDILQPIVGMQSHENEPPRVFRYKIATPFAPMHTRAKNPTRASKGTHEQIACGFFEPGTHDIVACYACPSEVTGARSVLNFIAKEAHKLGISAYDEDTHTGVLRHAILRYSKYFDEAMLVLVTKQKLLPKKRLLVQRIRARFPHITTIIQNVNSRQTNAMLGNYCEVLYGAGVVRDKLLGCTFEIGPLSFYQTNPTQTEVLYQLAIDFLREGLERSVQGKKRVKKATKKSAQKAGHKLKPLRILDAYCGCGTIGICAAAAFEDVLVVGVDQVEDAIVHARKNRKLNHLGSRCVFSCQDATEFMRDFAYADETARKDASPAEKRFDAVIMDPPRAGSTPEFIAGVSALAPTCVVYISCNPKTQVRDLKEFEARGYEVVCICPVDMFPHTEHVECIVLMSRVN